MTVRARLDSFVMLSCMNIDWPAAGGTISVAVPEQNTPAAVSVSLRDDPNAGRYEVPAEGLRTIAALVVLREHVLKPLLAGVPVTQ